MFERFRRRGLPRFGTSAAGDAALEEGEVIDYPPPARGLPRVGLDRLLEKQLPLLADLRQALPLSDGEFDGLFMPVVRRLAGLAPVNVFVDEAAEVVNAPFLQVLNKGRGALFRLTVATQTIADFVSRMGGEAPADQLLGNLNNVVALRLLDERTKEFFARKLPMTTYRHIMETMANSTDAGLVHSGNVGARLMEAEGELFPPALLGNLPDLEFLANFSGGRVVKGRLPILGASS